MPLKQVHSAYDFITLSNVDNDLINVSVSIELPLEDNEQLDYKDCIVVYFYYDFSAPNNKREYKLFKYYANVTKQDIEKDFIDLGKLQGLYIILNMSKQNAIPLIEKFNKRHIST